MLNKSLFSSNSDLWNTPLDFFNNLNCEFHFDLDPCTISNNLNLPYFFTPSDDGLSQDWFGTVFCNPPYSDISSWVKKCFYEWYNHNCTIVLLIPARTDTRYFHEFIYPYCKLRFIKGRLHFNDSKNSCPFPSMLCIYESRCI